MQSAAHDATPPATARKSRPPYDPASDVIRPYHLQQVVGLSETTIWRMRARGQFPQPVRLSTGTVGWLRADVAAWLASRCRKNESAPAHNIGSRR